MGAVCERRTWCGKRGDRVLEMGAVCERRTWCGKRGDKSTRDGCW